MKPISLRHINLKAVTFADEHGARFEIDFRIDGRNEHYRAYIDYQKKFDLYTLHLLGVFDWTEDEYVLDETLDTKTKQTIVDILTGIPNFI